MYNQLRYYSHIFDAKKAAETAGPKAKGKLMLWFHHVVPSADHLEDELTAISGVQLHLLETMNHTIGKYLDQSGRRWVDLRSLFSFMRI